MDRFHFKKNLGLLITLGAFIIPIRILSAQQSLMNVNLIVNGNAEAGSAGTSQTDIVPIPGWTRSGNATVLLYGQNGYLQTKDPAPPDHGFQYFIGGYGGPTSTLSQDIDVSGAAASINAGTVEFAAAAYLGTDAQVSLYGAQMDVIFKNAKGQIFQDVAVGPGGLLTEGTSLQQQIGLVPAGTTTITVTLTLTDRYRVADSLSLILNPIGTDPNTVLGHNLVTNGNAESGPSAPPEITTAYVPGWSTDGASVCPYGGSNWIQITSPGPSDRGVSLFCGPGSMYQDVDVSAAGSLIDAGQINYNLSAFLGVVGGTYVSTLTYTFFDWTGRQLAPTAQMGDTQGPGTGLEDFTHSDTLPAGTRRVRIAVTFTEYYHVADDISFSIGGAGTPAITSGGVVPVYSSVSTIEPGSWISIFGTNLAATSASWNGDFPTELANTSVTINNKPAYLWFVSPGQINLQAPDDTATGPVNVVVTTAAGSSTSTVILSQYAPSFSMFTATYPAALVLTPGAPGNSGNGYDIIGPGGNGLSIPSRKVNPGETVLLYGVGFGPTTPAVPAGATFSGAAPTTELPVVTIGGIPATVSFAGIIEAGLYQLNVVVPGNTPGGDQPLAAMIGGVTTPSNVVISVQ